MVDWLDELDGPGEDVGMVARTACDVVIVGGGPAGLITALGLARAGVDVVVLERSSGVVPEPRAMVYHAAVLEGLSELGILDDMEHEGFRLREMCYRILRTGEVIKLGLDALEGRTRFPYSVILGQDQLAGIVLRHLARHPTVTVLWSAEVTGVRHDPAGATVRASVSGTPTDVRGAWVVGADGARSLVRKAAGVEFAGFTWPEQFVATNVRYDLNAHGWDDCNYLVDPEYGAVIAKVTTDGMWRVTFAQPAAADPDSVEERIQSYYRAVLPGNGPYHKVLHSVYTMHQRLASELRVGRVLLVGDAAHATNPTNGFGLVSGIIDGLILSEALGAVIAGRADEDVLDQYSADRRRVFDEVVTPTSSETKRLVFHTTDDARREADLQELRRLAGDPGRRADFLMTGYRLLTPSLVST